MPFLNLTKFDNYQIIGGMAADRIQRLSKAFKALSHPHRLLLFLNMLKESRLDKVEGSLHRCFLTDILGDLQVGAPTVSHHVKELVNAGLIETHRDGKFLTCTVNPEMMRDLRSVLELDG